MGSNVRRPLAAALALSMLALPGALSARERRGAEIAVSLKDGRTVSGELIAVRPDALLLLARTGRDESVERADIATLRVFKRGSTARGFLYGNLAGAAGGALIGYTLFPHINEYPEMSAIQLGIVGAILGGFVGVVTQSGTGRGREIVIAGRPEAEVERVWAKLNRLARERSPR